MGRMLCGSWMMVATCIVPCGGDNGESVLVFGEVDASSELADVGGFLHIRAFPDHDEGFDIRRVYTGDDDVFVAIPEHEVAYPFEYELEGRMTTDAYRFRVLAWRSTDPDATWVAPGEHYGQATFLFICDDQDHCEGEFVDVAIYTVAPPE